MQCKQCLLAVFRYVNNAISSELGMFVCGGGGGGGRGTVAVMDIRDLRLHSNYKR